LSASHADQVLEITGRTASELAAGERPDRAAARRQPDLPADGHAAIQSLTSIVEPLMMILVGLMVGVIVIAMYLPMFKMLSLVK
jgi:hypothetical protein